MSDSEFCPGVFCDVIGTLVSFDKGEINKKVLETLEDFTAKGVRVTLWTGGDIKKNEELLHSLGIKSFELVPKRDYVGKEVEIALDDESPADIFSKYGVKIREYRKVEPIFK
ncbi:HAD hydrolase family protein [Patescibacteria group bacterium]|nr:HAD hydrolase family protein [Patescibacteria group bacterium]